MRETVVCPTHGIETARLERHASKEIPDVSAHAAIIVRAVLACGHEMQVVTHPAGSGRYRLERGAFA